MIFLAFILPIAIYLLLLAKINRRSHPVVVSGPWDFVGIIFAASGFLLFGGPAILSSLSLSDAWRNFWLAGRDASKLADRDYLHILQMILFAIYFVVVVGGAWVLIWRRQRSTVIYNVDPAIVSELLEEVCERLQISYTHAGSLFILGQGDSAASGRSVEVSPFNSSLDDRMTIIEMDALPGMCHVTLHWDPCQGAVRQTVEAEFQRELAQIPSPTSSVGDWLFVAACTLLGVCFLGSLILIGLWLIPR